MNNSAAQILSEFMNPGTRSSWKSYGCTHRGRMDAWVTPEELARIDAGVTSGTIETRVVPDQIGKIHQWREKVG